MLKEKSHNYARYFQVGLTVLGLITLAFIVKPKKAT
jgi:hypothetical protein